MLMKIFYVRDATGSGVGFDSEVDALYASTGVAKSMFVNEMAVKFRRVARAKAGKVFPVIVIEIPDAEKNSEPAQQIA